MSLKVGEVETFEDREECKRRPSIATGKGGGNNPRRGGGGGGGGGDRSQPEDSPDEFEPSKYRVGMWIVLSIVIMTFSALIGTYVVLAINQQMEWRPAEVPMTVWLSTVAILISSLTFEIVRQKLFKGLENQARNFLLITTILGLIFIVFQSIAWSQLANNPALRGSSYVGLFYLLTIIHAVHVLVGILALFYLLWKMRQPSANEESTLKRTTAVNFIAGYWHTVDGLWLILLGLLVYFR